MDDKDCTVLYKILTPSEKDAMPEKAWKGTSLDLKDGFIHTSLSYQLPTTLKLFFGKQSGAGDELYLCSIPVKNIKERELKFEPAGCGHIYGTIDPATDISETIMIQRQIENGEFHLSKLQF